MKFLFGLKSLAVIIIASICILPVSAQETESDKQQIHTSYTEKSTVQATPAKELETILKRQKSLLPQTLLKEYLNTETLHKEIKEKGFEYKLSLNCQEGMTEALGLGWEYSFLDDSLAQLSIQWNPYQKYWNLNVGAETNGVELANANLHGDTKKLLLSCTPFYDGTIGIDSGSFLEQYSGSALEKLISEELELPEISEVADFDLVFYPEDTNSVNAQNPIRKIQRKFQKKFEKVIEHSVVEKETFGENDIYYVTFNAKDVLQIGQVVHDEIIAKGLDFGLMDYSDAMRSVRSFLQYINRVTYTLGETAVLEFWTENDVLLSVGYHMTVRNKIYSYDSEGERVPDTNVLDISAKLFLADEQNPLEIFVDIQNKKYDDLSLSIKGTVNTEVTDSEENTSLTLEILQGDELMYSGIPFTSTLDTKTGALNASISLGDEEEEDFLIILDSHFSEVTEGKGFVWNMDTLSMTIDSQTIGINGNISLTTELEEYSEPEDVTMACDASAGDIFTVMSEIYVNAQEWRF